MAKKKAHKKRKRIKAPKKKGPKKKKWSKAQYAQIAKLAGHGLSVERIGHFFGISKRTMERYIKSSRCISDALEKGRAIAEAQASETAFMLAVGRKKEVVDGKVKTKPIAPSVVMLIFWLKCRARWQETSNLNVVPGENEKGQTLVDLAAAHWKEKHGDGSAEESESD